MDSGANNSGPDGTDDGGCERDWGFETHSRRTFTLGHDNSASGAELGDVGVLDDTLTDDDHRRRQVGWWETLWESIFIFTLHD